MTIPARIDNEPAYILHSRAYRETSQLLEVFSHDYGRVGLVARGARRPRSPFRGLLNAFQPLRLSWSGRGELHTLRDAELSGFTGTLDGERVLAGFYINELLLKLLQRSDPHPELFALYTQSIGGLLDGAELEPLLRRFELGLLEQTGYALNLRTDGVRHEALQADQLYEFRVEQGAVPVLDASGDALCFTGAQLIGVGQLDFTTTESRATARRLLRFVISYHVGDRGLQTRRVAAAMKR